MGISRVWQYLWVRGFVMSRLPCPTNYVTTGQIGFIPLFGRLVTASYKGLHKMVDASLSWLRFSHVVRDLHPFDHTPFVLSRQLSNIGLAEYNLTGYLMRGGMLAYPSSVPPLLLESR